MRHVYPAKVKAPYGVAQRGTAVHVPSADGRAVYEDGRAVFWATWLCGHNTRNAIFMHEPDGRPLCRRCADLSEPPRVYRCFGKDGGLLYIGCTSQWRTRRNSHEKHSHWWPLVADVRHEEFPTPARAFAAEQFAIGTENPLHNIAGRPLTEEQAQRRRRDHEEREIAGAKARAALATWLPDHLARQAKAGKVPA
jgi:hypothetical protein